MKKTLFYEDHLKLNGKLVDFAGFQLPIQYSSILHEHHNVRNKAGLFDVSHMGEFIISGPESVPFVQYLITNDLNSIPCGSGILYTPFCKENGGIVDDMLVYYLDSEKIMLVVNAANIEKDFTWCSEVSKKFDVNLENLSDKYSQMAIQGPLAENILNRITEYDLASIKPFRFVHTRVYDIDCLVSRTGYTGEDGFEIYTCDPKAKGLFIKLIRHGENDGLVPAGLGARDTLRFEAKLLLYGNDIDESTTPIEATLGWTVKFDKGDFIGKDVMFRQKQEKPDRKLVGIKLIDKGIPRHGYTVLDSEGENIGTITSGTKSPTLGDSLALAYVKKGNTRPGTELQIKIRNKIKKGIVVKTPFYKRK